jgi:hypothetical protein
MITSMPMSSARSDGVWNLTLLAGVQTVEVFFAQFVFSLIQCTIMALETLFTICLLYPWYGVLANFWIIFCLLFVLCISVIFFEFWLSCVTRNFTAIFNINLGLNWFMFSLSGLNW